MSGLADGRQLVLLKFHPTLGRPPRGESPWDDPHGTLTLTPQQWPPVELMRKIHLWMDSSTPHGSSRDWEIWPRAKEAQREVCVLQHKWQQPLLSVPTDLGKRGWEEKGKRDEERMRRGEGRKG